MDATAIMVTEVLRHDESFSRIARLRDPAGTVNGARECDIGDQDARIARAAESVAAATPAMPGASGRRESRAEGGQGAPSS